jgi:hypothetical protein
MKVTVEGVIAHEDVDPDGDQFVLDGVTYQRFLETGYLTKRCSATPEMIDIIGQPKSIERTERGLVLKAEVTDIHLQNLLLYAGEQDSKFEMGFALAGVMQEHEPLEGGRALIKRCDVRAVALLPADQLSDPRCLVTAVVDKSKETS